MVYTSSAAAVGPAENGRRPTRRSCSPPARLGIPYVNSVHEAEVEAMRVAARGLPLVCVNPAVCSGPAITCCPRPGWCAASCSAASRSTRTAPWIVDVRDVAAGHLLADVRGARGRALHPRGPQLHLRPPVRRPRPAVRRAHAGPAPAARRAGGRSACWGRPAAPGRSRRPRCARPGTSWTYRSTKARRELGWRARPHEETLEATVAWHLEREHDRIARSRRSQQIQYRLAGAGAGRGRGRGACVVAPPS